MATQKVFLQYNNVFLWLLYQLDNKQMVIVGALTVVKQGTIHQAMVLNMRYVLFAMAQVGGQIIYSVLIHVTPAQVSLYKQSLDNWEYLWKWAHDADNCNILLLNNIPPHLVETAKTHIPLWKAVRQKVKEQGPMAPVSQFKTAKASLYCVLKTGVDKSSQAIFSTYNSKQKFTLTQKIPAHTLRAIVLNSFVAYRSLKKKIHCKLSIWLRKISSK